MPLKIAHDRTIIPACDGDLKRFVEILRATCELSGVGAYKIGSALALSVGLPRVVEIAREYTKKPLIYDHQKAGTDIPDTAGAFMDTLKSAGIDAVILFPFGGPQTQSAWTLAAQAKGLSAIIGGHMTHDGFLKRDGGYIAEDAVQRIYEHAATQGIIDYVVPGNRPDVVKEVKTFLSAHDLTPVFYAPGFISQGGQLTTAAEAAGPRWHAIVGRALYEAQDIQRTASSLISTL